jgi:hypothetical protein
MAGLRGSVKAARTRASATPGLAETLARDWRKAAWFYARFGINETMFRHGVPADEAERPRTVERVTEYVAASTSRMHFLVEKLGREDPADPRGEHGRRR